MRKLLDALYDGAAWLAALFMFALLVAVLLSIGGRELHFHVKGTDAYAGYFMAAAGFLALAHTLKRGEHIRVSLLLSALPARARHAMELWALASAVALSGLLAFYAGKLAWQSHAFNDISTGNDATPLWIPQLGMAVGTLILFIAFVDEFVLEWRSRRARVLGDG
ncbi:MAG: TRAP transporter small permease, partial [Aquincola sp.]|nr:TRAP transporter small permease [Aquincola sp.]